MSEIKTKQNKKEQKLKLKSFKLKCIKLALTTEKSRVGFCPLKQAEEFYNFTKRNNKIKK
jgi:hypothetical protein